MAVTAAVVGAVATVGGSAIQAKAQKKGRKAQQLANAASFAQQEKANQVQQEGIETQNRLQQKQADISNQRNRVRSIREARIKRGQIAAGAQNAGVSGSSGAIGGASSISSQLTSNLGFGDQQLQIARDLGDNNVATQGALGDINVNLASIATTNSANQAKAQEGAALGAAIGGLGSSIFSAGGGFKTIFGAKQPNPGFTFNG